MPATRNPELIARKLLKELGIRSAPVALKPIARKLGIELVQEDLGEELSGVLIKESEKVVIAVNAGHPENRRRFTAAHEIAHFVLGHPGEMFVDKTLRQKAVVIRRDGRSSEGTDKHEIEANRFAAELLMPQHLVEAEVTKKLSKQREPRPEILVADLATHFKVSKQAMEIRLVNLGFLFSE